MVEARVAFRCNKECNLEGVWRCDLAGPTTGSLVRWRSSGQKSGLPLALRLFLAPTFCHLALETLPTSDPYPPFNLLLLFLSFSSLSSPRRLQTCPSLQPTCKKCVFLSISSSRTGARARAVARQRTRARISSFQPSEAPHELPLRLPLLLAVEHHVVLCADAPSCVLLSFLAFFCFVLGFFLPCSGTNSRAHRTPSPRSRTRRLPPPPQARPTAARLALASSRPRSLTRPPSLPSRRLRLRPRPELHRPGALPPPPRPARHRPLLDRRPSPSPCRSSSDPRPIEMARSSLWAQS